MSAALLVLWLPASNSRVAIPSDLPSASKAIAESVAASSSSPRAELPDAPSAKVDPSSEPASSSAPPFGNAPIKPALERPVPTPRQERLWYTFMAVSHGAAAFDAWTTRRAVSGGYGTEGDPLLRPFAHTNAIYAATQVSPAVMDYIGRRMMTSTHPSLRRLWWLPQVAGAGLSFGSGLHNYSLVQ